MQNSLPATLDLNTLKIIEATLTIDELDDLLEIALSHLLGIDGVRQAEVLLFNRYNELIEVGSATNQGPKGQQAPKIRVQSWLIDSAVKHSTRRSRSPSLFFVYSIPLIQSHRLMGFVNVQLDQIPTANNSLIGNFYLIGMQLATKIKEITLQNEIKDLQKTLQLATADNKDNQQRITSLSKELYAISAISTKINQSMDLKKSLRKAMSKIKEVFKTSNVVVCLKPPGRSKKITTIALQDQMLPPALLDQIEQFVQQKIIEPGQSEKTNLHLAPLHADQHRLKHGAYKSIIGVPMQTQKKLIGALVLLHDSAHTINQESLRLLSGIANIMGMAVENMSLFQQSQQKKREAAFLVQSISKFNQKLDLETTLKAIAQKGFEFLGRQGQVLLFSETKLPMVQLTYDKLKGRKYISSKAFARIQPQVLEDFYRRLILQKRPSLIGDVRVSRKIKPRLKTWFLDLGIQSMVMVPLRLMEKPMGLLLLGNANGRRLFNARDLTVAEALGVGASVAIENARAYNASLEMSEFLEKKISEKTSQIARIQERQKIRVENRKDIIFRINKSNRFVFVNKAMEIVSGCSREELYRGDIKALDVVATEDQERVQDCIRLILKRELPLIKDLEYRHLNRNGEDHIISLTIYPETDHFGRIIGVEGVGNDITEEKRLETELDKAKDLALLGEFSAAIAHQIRNPLGNILMGTKLLQRAVGMDGDEASDAEQAQAGLPLSRPPKENLRGIFKNLFDGIHNLNQVVTELVEYTKTLRLTSSSQRIDVILEETLALFQEIIAQKGIQVETSFSADVPLLEVDAVLIGQVFQNIIYNAIQAMNSGGQLSIFTGFAPHQDAHAMISIGDTGAGIEPSEVEKIFHPFYTTKDSGTGLGLSLAHRIVEAHQGNIWVCANPCVHRVEAAGSDPGMMGSQSAQGVTFHILLPIQTPMRPPLTHKGTLHETADPVGR